MTGGGVHRTKIYASYAPTARGMAAVWLVRPPDGRDPEGWATDADGTTMVATRLAELACARGPFEVIRVQSCHAELWEATERKRRCAARRAARKAHAEAQIGIPIPADVEQLGREVALERKWAR